MNENAPNHGDHQSPNNAHRGHGLMMIACCIPMLVIAVVLVASGAASPGFLLVAIGCTAMMAMMMRAMPGHATDGKTANDLSGHPNTPIRNNEQRQT